MLRSPTLHSPPLAGERVGWGKLVRYCAAHFKRRRHRVHDLNAVVVFPPYRLDRMPVGANFRAGARGEVPPCGPWTAGVPPALCSKIEEKMQAGRPRSQDARSGLYLPRDSCHSKNIPDPTTIAEPASSAADGRSPHTRYPIMIAHTSEK